MWCSYWDPWKHTSTRNNESNVSIAVHKFECLCSHSQLTKWVVFSVAEKKIRFLKSHQFKCITKCVLLHSYRGVLFVQMASIHCMFTVCKVVLWYKVCIVPMHGNFGVTEIHALEYIYIQTCETLSGIEKNVFRNKRL